MKFASSVRFSQIPRIDLLKIDVEGAELSVLRGVRREHWPRVRAVVAEVHDVAAEQSDSASAANSSGDAKMSDAKDSSAVAAAKDESRVHLVERLLRETAQFDDVRAVHSEVDGNWLVYARRPLSQSQATRHSSANTSAAAASVVDGSAMSDVDS